MVPMSDCQNTTWGTGYDDGVYVNLANMVRCMAQNRVCTVLEGECKGSQGVDVLTRVMLGWSCSWDERVRDCRVNDRPWDWDLESDHPLEDKARLVDLNG